MKATIDPIECPATPMSPEMSFVVVYEDRSTGCRAKVFAERLAAAAGRSSQIAGLWRSDLLKLAPLADEAAREARGCDVILISLRGGGVVPFAIRDWLEARLVEAGAPPPALVAIFEPAWSGPRAVAGARHYFHELCAGRGVPIFSYVAAPEGRPGGAGLRERPGGLLRAASPGSLTTTP